MDIGPAEDFEPGASGKETKLSGHRRSYEVGRDLHKRTACGDIDDLWSGWDYRGPSRGSQHRRLVGIRYRGKLGKGVIAIDDRGASGTGIEIFCSNEAAIPKVSFSGASPKDSIKRFP